MRWTAQFGRYSGSVTARQTRGPYAKGTERREQIVQTATDVFAKEGFEGAALKRVAELVGVREATLFHYFTSKQELLTAVLAERDRRSMERFGGDISLESMPGIAERNQAEPGLTALYAVASATAHDPGHDSHEYFRQRYEGIVADLAGEIREAQEKGAVRDDVPAELVARLVFSVFDGIQLQWLYNKDVSMPEALRTFIDVLLAPPARG